MLRQYRTQTILGGDNPLQVGPLAVGTMFRFESIVRYRPTGYRKHPYAAVYGDIYIIDGFENRDYTKRVGNTHISVKITGGHLVVVRNIRTGQTKRVADHIIRHALDTIGELRGGYTTPIKPDMNLYRVQQKTPDCPPLPLAA